ncbi:DNA topoisomerase IB [uncultured Sulfitobacter sp.]|uniref:DNA topoisomerase IB n=1 Tax=uncultured Sulfitobacter sp. TaxID=191468 RepID=UPI00261D9DB4|nr:DNA topoisomerase IB [uncultured Sulfitobacter sp.]
MSTSLVYVTDAEPGISRRRRGRGFSYVAPDGTTIARGAERARIEALAVPPAYEDVWICSKENGHLQATGRDTRHRKQYRYHPQWSAKQATTKYEQLADFGEVLPKIRRRVERDLSNDPGDAEFALAAAVLMIDRAALRVGQQEYTDQNGSYGALTLRRRHLRIRKDALELKFTAKGGTKVRKELTDKKLQKMLHKIQDVEGATLLSWTDEAGAGQSLSSHQLNNYLTEASGKDEVTAKTFRTWAGTLAAFECAEKGHATITEIAEAASKRLHNTPSVARNSYIHPAVIALSGEPPVAITPLRKSGLFVAEQRLLGLLTR